MPSLLYQLENNEAILLMYLAGELPPEDAAEVEQHLSQDAGLRAALASLRGTVDGVTDIMARPGDGAGPATLDAQRAAAVRRVSREMVRRHAEAEACTAAAEANSRARRRAGTRLYWRMPRWAKPIAVAAMLLIAWLAYWGLSAADVARPQHRTGPRDIDYAGISDDARDAATDLLATDPMDRQALAAAESLDDAAGADLGALIRRVPPSDVGVPRANDER